MSYLIFILAVVFALNMGGSSFGAAFAPAFGGRVLSRNQSAILFLIFVLLGGVFFGRNVSGTLGHGLVSFSLYTYKTTAIILFVCSLSMIVANWMKIPQSTSLVTVAAISGVGVSLGKLNLNTLGYLIPFWLILPLLSFGITYFLTGVVYPPREKNFWIYEKFIHHERKLKLFVLLSCCYCAFSVGTNNVANVIGPLIYVSNFSITQMLFVFACFYGIGGFVFSGPLKTAGKAIVPLGLMTASIITFVAASLMIVASIFGVPQSFVMLQLGAVFAVSCKKEGHELTFSSSWARKTFVTWVINPLLTFMLSYGLVSLI